MANPLDVVVVGGGPVGLVAALEAQQQGLAVGVVEPRLPPIDKACGEGIMPAGLATLKRLGVAPPGSPIRGIRYLHGGRHAEARLPQPGLGVRRTALHADLAEAARAAGVQWFAWAAGTVQQSESGVVVPPKSRNRAEPVRAKYALVADGLHSPQRRALGMDRPRGQRRRGRRCGLRQHYAITPWTDHVEVYWGAHAEAYVTPLPHQIGVAILTEHRGSFEEHLQAFPALRSRLHGAHRIGQVRGAGPFGTRSRRRVRGRVLLIGDAAGYADALTGEGLSVGFAQGVAAVEAIVNGRPSEYEPAWRSIALRSSVPTMALVHATRLPPVRRLLVPAAAAAPGLFAAGVVGVASAGSARSPAATSAHAG